ncbi:MAG TPA: glycogen/starch synthase [Candidatus Paceibacterota bacterium]
MPKRLNIAQIAAEVEPFSKSGGLANVMGSLPRVLKKLGHRVLVITPYYEGVTNLEGHTAEIIAENVVIEVTMGVFETVTYIRSHLPDSKVPVYFICCNKYFDRREEIGTKLYGASDDNARFLVFNVAALHLLQVIDCQPDVIHCHDWHTGLIPYFLRNRYKKEPFWAKAACLFTIHNLVYQLGHDWWVIPKEARDDGRSYLPSFAEKDRLERVNFAKRGIMNADAINAVSETYRNEIMTENFGEELHDILKAREDRVFGIVNGIDYNDYNPLTDPGVLTHYSYKSAGRKKENKTRLQKAFGLSDRKDAPLIVMTSRISEQKGFALMPDVIPHVMSFGAQMIVMGDGDAEMVAFLKRMQAEYPGQFAYSSFDGATETSLYAGADMFLLPSRYEPCGVNQLIALRYGCIPIVHHIGGLADTIVDFDARTRTGNGFTATRYDASSVLVAIARAIETYKHKDVWKKLVISGLKEANSWLIPAKKYAELYNTTRRLRRALKKKK